MAEKSAIQRIKDLDAERASIFDQAKEEALEKAKAAVAELNALGLNYTLSNGAGKQAKTATAKGKAHYQGGRLPDLRISDDTSTRRQDPQKPEEERPVLGS